MSFQSFFPNPMASFQVMSFARVSFQLLAEMEGASDGADDGASDGIGSSDGSERTVGAEIVEMEFFGTIGMELFGIVGTNHSLSVCCGDNNVCQLTSFVISPSTGMKSGCQEGVSARLSFPGVYNNLKLNSTNSRVHLACLQLRCCKFMKYLRFL